MKAERNYIIRPQWYREAKNWLVTKKSDKEYLRFLKLLADIQLGEKLDPNDDSKAAKLIRTLSIEAIWEADLTRYEKKCRRKTFDSDSQKADLQENPSGNSIIAKDIIANSIIANNKEQNADANMQTGNAAMQSSMDDEFEEGFAKYGF